MESDLIAWILEQGCDCDSLASILGGACTRLTAMGVPLFALGIGMPTISPTQMYTNADWWKGGVPLGNLFATDDDALRGTPVASLMQDGLLRQRWKLDDPAIVGKFGLFAELRALGATEYAAQLVRFSEGRTTLRGAALAIVTDRPGGFAGAHIELMTRLLPALSLTAYRIALLEVARETLGAYLGPGTGDRVLHGMIRRGDCQTMPAALLLADLRGFTAFVDQLGEMAAVELLNEHLEAIGDPVADSGGEVLKFLGDGLLAAFPLEGPSGDAAACCGKAVRAAIEARRRTDELNARRARAGKPQLGLQLVLHFGEVAYGNIGTARRLDFTVIGRAVNEASRMEALGKSIGQPLLLSESFARLCAHTTASLGPFPLRGVKDHQEIYVLVPGCG